MKLHRSGFPPLFARIALGGIFAFLGAAKAADPISFLKLVRQFDVIHAPLALNATAAVLPWFEVFCGLLLIAGIKPRATALILGVMLAVFTSLVVVRAAALHQAGAIAWASIRFDCGCGTGEVLAWVKLLENLGLMLLAVFVVAVPAAKLTLWRDA